MAKRKSKRNNKLKLNKSNSKGKEMPKRWHPTPLKGSFMVLAIIGFLVTTYLIYPVSQNIGIAMLLVFTAMFIASIISMTKAPVVE
jgi:uncharacterized membrane protein YhaH (DUF805 family)